MNETEKWAARAKEFRVSGKAGGCGVKKRA